MPRQKVRKKKETEKKGVDDFRPWLRRQANNGHHTVAAWLKSDGMAANEEEKKQKGVRVFIVNILQIPKAL